LVQVARPDGSFLTGGGFLLPNRSAGAYPANSGTPASFAFDVKFRDRGQDPTGNVLVQFESGGRTYMVRSTTVQSLGLTQTGTSAKADVRATAELIDVTNPLQPMTVGTGLTLQMTATDRGSPGNSDSLGITLWDGSTLVHSSDWNGTRTQEITLGGGNLVVH